MHCVHFCEAEEWRMAWYVRYIRVKIVKDDSTNMFHWMYADHSGFYGPNHRPFRRI
jgi:hypothetical protein